MSARRAMVVAAVAVGLGAGEGRGQADPMPPPPNARPVFPIPTGPAEPDVRTVLEWDPAGWRAFRTQQYVDGGAEWSIGRPGEFRRLTSLFQSDYSRTQFVVRGNATGGPPGCGLLHELFLSNSYCLRSEVEVGGRPRAAARLVYYPLEGVAVGLGVDSRRGVALSLRLHVD